jgi:hypothetical protein
MNKEQHNDLLYKIIAIHRMKQSGKHGLADTAVLRILARLVTEIYETQEAMK